MNCPIKTQENNEWLLEYSAGRLGREHAAVLGQHLEGCAECRRFVEEQRVVWNVLGEWEAQDVSPHFNRRLYQKIDQSQPFTWLNRLLQPLWRPVVPLAAACLLIVAGVALHIPVTPLNPDRAQARVESVEPEQVERTLDDLQMLREMALTPPQEANPSQPM
jgi:hypothetical protein